MECCMRYLKQKGKKMMNNAVQDVQDFLSGLDFKNHKGDLKFYSSCKRELSYLCGYEAIGEVPADLYDKAEKHLIRVLEI